VLTNIYIKCKNLFVQLSVFHKRGEYYWIGSDTISKNDALWFGDVDRAMNSFNLINLNDELKIPIDINQFLFDYKHSRFIECNRELSQSNRDSMGPEYKRDLKKENDFLFGLKYIKSVLEGFHKNYWLAAGTLLGT
jgi:hypothetical protein